MLSFAMLLLIIDPTFIPHRFGILSLPPADQLDKNDRAKRSNKSAIRIPQSKIFPKS
jgi:hypothetical protein